MSGFASPPGPSIPFCHRCLCCEAERHRAGQLEEALRRIHDGDYRESTSEIADPFFSPTMVIETEGAMNDVIVWPGRDVAPGWRLVTWDSNPPQLWRHDGAIAVDVTNGCLSVERCDGEREAISVIPMVALEAFLAQHRTHPDGLSPTMVNDLEKP